VPSTLCALTRSRAVGAALSASLAIEAAPAIATAQETGRASVDSTGVEGNGDSGAIDASSLSADGQVVAFDSVATNLVAGDTNGVSDLFVHDRTSGRTERVSVASNGTQANDGSDFPSLSADGRCVAFESFATNLVAGDVNGFSDVFVRDRTAGTTERVSVSSAGVEGDGDSYSPAISADGRIVVFQSYATNLVVGDTNGSADVFVHDRVTGVTDRVSVDSAGLQSDSGSGGGGMRCSADGRFVAFDSDATNLVAGDVNGLDDVFVHDRLTGITERVSVDSAGAEADSYSFWPSLSADGSIVAFFSHASNLVAGDTNGAADVFVHDRSTGATTRVSVDSAGAEANSDSGASGTSLSSNGRYVAFDSHATNLVANDVNGWPDLFVHDRATGVTTLASVDSAGVQGDDNSFYPALAGDGVSVAFLSDATNLVASDTNGAADVFVHDLCATVASWSNYGAGFPGTSGVPSFTAQSNPVLNQSLALDLANSRGAATLAVLFVGFTRTKIHSGWGGDLLVAPVLTLVISLPAGGLTLTGQIPDDESLCGIAVDLQAIESDPGAAKGVSFTPGLELVIGS
jgi:hypothetical protein